MIQTIKTFNSWKYSEIYKVTEYREDSVYKTQSTGKYIRTVSFPPHGFVLANISTSKLKGDTVDLDIVEDFEGL